MLIMCIPFDVFFSAPPALVRAQFDSLAAVLTPLLANAPPPLLRSLTTCLTHALVALPLSFWTSDAACRRTWRMLLLLSADPRPKVRKRAQDGVKLILSKPPTPVTNHPGTAAALEFISNGLDAAKPSRGEDRDAATLHLLAFLSSILPLLFRGASLPPVLAALRNLLKKVLALPSVSPDGSTATSVLSVFASLFSTDDSHDLDPELLAEFVRSLLENLKPNERDVGLAPIWLEVVAQGFARLAHVITRAENGSDYVEAYSAVLGGFFATAFDGFLSQPVKPAITNAATQSLALVLAEALGPVVSPPHPALAQLISKICSSLGSIKFQKNMGALLRLLAPLYDSLAGSPALSVLLDGSLPTLIGFRDAMDHNPEFTAREELELCLESVVRSAGIQTVISYAPLNIRKEEQGPGSPPRAYLLTTFRRALEGRSETRFGPDGLSLIIGTLLPLASDEFKLSLAATNPVVKKLHGTLAGQIWALLPGLARTAPMDVAEYFGKLMMNWGKILRRQSDLPDVEEAEECLGLVCEALAGLVEAQLRVKENGSEDAQQKADENLRAIGKQGNKILTVLCGLFTELPPSGAKPDEKTERERNRIRSAIAAFLRIANGADVTAYFASLVMGVAKASVEGKPEARYTSLELLGILLPHLPELDAQEKPTLDAYLRLLATEVKDADAGVQKRAYRGLQAAALRMGGERVEAVLRGLVQEDIAGAVVSQARKARLGCLASLVKALPEGNTQLLVELVPEVLPEAISGTKEAGEKARQAGFECLLEMGRRVVQQAGVKEYFAMVSAGLASAEAKMQSASVACLSRLLFEFSDMMDQQLVGDVVDAALFAAESRNRELAKAGLGFIKVAVVTLPQELLENHLDRIIQALLVHSREHASHFKEKTRHIFERLIRRFSYEAVEGFVPEEDRKLLSNIRKRKERAKRRKSAAEADEEDEAPIERPSRSRTYEEVMADTDESDASSEEEDDGKFNAAGKVCLLLGNGGKSFLI